ncbi:hypothetical protein O181_103536 [Austropuccinia psidii MF-1]|uniref:Uncharacterized protein n=1 Tax=Austropuccinia psidii MF-1 TaxID=1389203 RepID=A0A9Q3JKP4_9BASI|nr:hypothetical protein [Austropuccinia psidii MF-1]
MPQDTENKNLCKHTQDAQTFLVTPAKGMEYINGKATKMTVFIKNDQHPVIIDRGAHCAIVGRTYLVDYFPNCETNLLPTKAKNFQRASGKMTSIDAHIQGLLLWTDYQMIYGIDIYNSKNRHITICKNKEKEFPLDIYQISTHDPLEKLLNEFRESKFSNTFTSKQKLSILKMLRKKRTAFAIAEYPLGQIRGHDIELYLEVERPYQTMLQRPPYTGILESRKEIEKHINEFLDLVSSGR